jgi:hypothetical protein
MGACRLIGKAQGMRGFSREKGATGGIFTRRTMQYQTQPVGLGRPPYLVIGFMGPVIHSLNIAF